MYKHVYGVNQPFGERSYPGLLLMQSIKEFIKLSHRRLLLSLGMGLLSAGHVAAQTTVVAPASDSLYPQKDLIGVIRMLRVHKDYLQTPVVDTLADHRRFHFSIVPIVGYTLTSGVAGIVSGNVVFYTNDKDHSQLSSISGNVTYTSRNQIMVPIQSNIITPNGKYNLVGDWRFYKYPQDTYGLGGHTKLSDADRLDYSYIRLYQSVLREVRPHFYAGLGYNLDYHWNIEEDGYGDGRKSDAQKYGLPGKTVSSGMNANLVYDTRQNPVNAPGGWYGNLMYRVNTTVLGSDNNWESMVLDVRKYIPLSKYRHSVLGFWSYDWIVTKGNPPYLDLPGTGWDNFNNTGRGYIQSRFRGKKMLYLESEYRFDISNNGLFGGVVFANAQSFSEWPSNRFEVVSPAAGIGLRIKVNKLSNTNIAIDYGIGTGGSSGLFVNLGEVF